MSPQVEFKIQPGDKPFLDRCARCEGVIAPSVYIAVWNGIEFAYCSACVNAARSPKKEKNDDF